MGVRGYRNEMGSSPFQSYLRRVSIRFYLNGPLLTNKSKISKSGIANQDPYISLFFWTSLGVGVQEDTVLIQFYR